MNTMELETKRLLLRTLDLDLIDAASRRDPKAFEDLGYHSNGEWPGTDFYEALPFFRELLVKNKGTRGFDSWIMVDKATRDIVGGIGFLGDPDPEGRIEIGFATNPSHQRQGYCHEAAQKLVDWASGQRDVKSIIARCEPGNTASQHALLKLGFQKSHEDSEIIHWIYPN